MGDLNGKCGDGVEMMIVNSFFFLSFVFLSFFLAFLKENMWETLQNDHDTNSEIERERWWKDLFIVTPLRTNDGGHRNTSESSR